MTPETKQLMFKDYQKIPNEFKCRYCKESMYEYPNASECESCEYAGTKFVMCINENCKLFRSFCCRGSCKSNIYCSEYLFKNETKQLIYSTSYISPLENLKEIKEFLTSIPFRQYNIVFDLLLYNGNNFNRFISVDFDYIEFTNFQILKDSEEIELVKSLSAEFYSKHPDFVENNFILSKPQKFLTRKGVVI